MSAPVTLKCANCAAPLRGEDWNVEKGVIKCSHCGVLSIVPGGARNSSGAFRPRGEVPLPPRLTISETPLGLEIKRRWFSAVVFFLIPFCIFWNGFLVVWYAIAFGSGSTAAIPMMLFPLIHVAVGLGLTYFVLATLFNSTVITAGSGRLSVKHGPVPWGGNLELDATDIGQFFCKEKVRNSKNGRQYTYEIWSVKRDSTTSKVVGAGLSMEQALFIEQKLERALGLQDRAVPGELDR